MVWYLQDEEGDSGARSVESLLNDSSTLIDVDSRAATEVDSSSCRQAPAKADDVVSISTEEAVIEDMLSTKTSPKAALKTSPKAAPKVSPKATPKSAKSNPLAKFLVKVQPGQAVAKVDGKNKKPSGKQPAKVSISKHTDVKEDEDDDIQIIESDPKVEVAKDKAETSDQPDSSLYSKVM